MANAISEAFKLVKANLWEKFQEEYILIKSSAMADGLATVSRNMAKAISEVF